MPNKNVILRDSPIPAEGKQFEIQFEKKLTMLWKTFEPSMPQNPFEHLHPLTDKALQ